MGTVALILQLLKLALEVFSMFQRQRISQKAAEDVVNDLLQTADYLVTRAQLAKTKVDPSDEAIINDPNNRANRSA